MCSGSKCKSPFLLIWRFSLKLKKKANVRQTQHIHQSFFHGQTCTLYIYLYTVLTIPAIRMYCWLCRFIFEIWYFALYLSYQTHRYNIKGTVSRDGLGLFRSGILYLKHKYEHRQVLYNFRGLLWFYINNTLNANSNISWLKTVSGLICKVVSVI
jgi:hypothetical protein